MSFVFVDECFARGMKEKFQQNQKEYRQLKMEMELCAEEYLPVNPFSVTYHACSRSPGGLKDYYSEGPYWWPDPDHPDGPYILKDGQVNPDRFTTHKNEFREMSLAVLSLCYAGYYLDRRDCSDRAAEWLKTWFLDPITGMNPHVDYGEAVIRLCTGKASGIIVVTSIDTCIHALGFLEACGGYDDLIGDMKIWLSKFLHWLRTSKIGVEESKSKNNHGTWYIAHIMAIAAYLEDEETLQYACDRFRQLVLSRQIAPDGSFPLELARTRSFHYSLFNCEAITVACEAAWYRGVDLWNAVGENGHTLVDAAEYLYPFYQQPMLWENRQLVGDISMDEAFFQLLSLRSGDDRFRALNQIRGKRCLLYRNKTPLGPLSLLPGYFE